MNEMLVMGALVTPIGLLCTGMFVRRIALKRYLKSHGVRTQGWVANVRRTREGVVTTIGYRDGEGNVYATVLPTDYGHKGDPVPVVYDPRDPNRVDTPGLGFVFWLVGGAVALYIGLNMLASGFQG